MRRTPVQTLVVAVAVGLGVIVGMRLIASRLAHPAARPDISLVDADLAALERAGYRFGAHRPQSWRDIDLRQFADDRGDLIVLRARMSADEAGALVRFPPESRRPANDAPPADWPRGGDGDPYRLPAWFAPRGGRSLCYEVGDGAGTKAGYAVYDPAQELMQLWAWRRSDVRLDRPAPRWAIADEIAARLADRLVHNADRAEPWVAERGQVRERPWLLARELAAADVIGDGRLPAARIDAALMPMRGEHRYLLAIAGIERDAALVVAGSSMPLRALPDDGAPPVDRWDFAAPGGTLPPWFAPGPGPRWCHVLVTIATGEVPAARWVAYDVAARRLFVWDWEDPAPQPVRADLTTPR